MAAVTVRVRPAFAGEGRYFVLVPPGTIQEEPTVFEDDVEIQPEELERMKVSASISSGERFAGDVVVRTMPSQASSASPSHDPSHAPSVAPSHAASAGPTDARRAFHPRLCTANAHHVVCAVPEKICDPAWLGGGGDFRSWSFSR
jgi:hypothetical protein